DRLQVRDLRSRGELHVEDVVVDLRVDRGAPGGAAYEAQGAPEAHELVLGGRHGEGAVGRLDVEGHPAGSGIGGGEGVAGDGRGAAASQREGLYGPRERDLVVADGDRAVRVADDGHRAPR